MSIRNMPERKKLPPAHASGSPNGLFCFSDLERQVIRQALDQSVMLAEIQNSFTLEPSNHSFLHIEQVFFLNGIRRAPVFRPYIAMVDIDRPEFIPMTFIPRTDKFCGRCFPAIFHRKNCLSDRVDQPLYDLFPVSFSLCHAITLLMQSPRSQSPCQKPQYRLARYQDHIPVLPPALRSSLPPGASCSSAGSRSRSVPRNSRCSGYP